jgi:hypothetical protein
MSLFALHQRVIEEYAQFVHAYVQIADPRVRAYTEQVLRDERALWPAPMLQLSPAYQYGVTLDALVREEVLHPETGRISARARASRCACTLIRNAHCAWRIRGKLMWSPAAQAQAKATPT